jgi:hypothetical protein
MICQSWQQPSDDLQQIHLFVDVCDWEKCRSISSKAGCEAEQITVLRHPVPTQQQFRMLYQSISKLLWRVSKFVFS